MQLTDKAQAEAFVFFMESERLRHLRDIQQIEDTVDKVCRLFEIRKPRLDPNADYWINVDALPARVELVKPGFLTLQEDDGYPD